MRAASAARGSEKEEVTMDREGTYAQEHVEYWPAPKKVSRNRGNIWKEREKTCFFSLMVTSPPSGTACWLAVAISL